MFRFLRKNIVLILKVLLLLLVARLILTAYFNRPHYAYVKTYAAQYEVEESLVYAVMFVESKFDADAESPREAKGLMQIADMTGAWAAETIGIPGYTALDLFDPKTNIQIGCWYLKNLENQFGDLTVLLAAYNAGSGNVSGWLTEDLYSEDGETFVSDNIIPFNETKNYVRKVKLVKLIYDILY